MLTYKNINDTDYTGRLGNQMFAIAGSFGIAIKNKIPFYLEYWSNARYFKGIFQEPDPNTFYNVELKIESPYYEEQILDPKLNYKISNYFRTSSGKEIWQTLQSIKYFEHCIDQIKELFTPTVEVKEDGEIAVHIRRTDYLNRQDIYPNLINSGYYNKAFELFPNGKFTIFSDDINWCKNNLTDNQWDRYNIRFADVAHPIIDLFQMINHKHFIIANSTFSWWGAFLGQKDNSVVIAPKQWSHWEDHNERILPDWITI